MPNRLPCRDDFSGLQPSEYASSPQACASPLATALSQLPAAIVAGLALWQAGAWLPECISILQTPSGISHDLWAWAPFGLDLGAIVAIAAPLSFKMILDTVLKLLSRKAG